MRYKQERLQNFKAIICLGENAPETSGSQGLKTRGDQ